MPLRLAHPRWVLAAAAGAAALVGLSPAIGRAAPSPSSVTVGVADADPTTAIVNGGPISGQGDNGLGQPLNPCPPGEIGRASCRERV